MALECGEQSKLLELLFIDIFSGVYIGAVELDQHAVICPRQQYNLSLL